ncbi:META domain-containing protein [Pelodictyon luteolum]|nr:META domain-containing protein [Pelodictyon luteolum]
MMMKMRMMMFGGRMFIGILIVAAFAGCARHRAALLPDVRLQGTQWRAIELDGSRVEFIPGQKLDVSLVLYRSGAFRAASGCSNLSGSYTMTAARMAFASIKVDRRPCPPKIKAREKAFLSALSRTAGYRKRGGSLSLFDRSGRRVAAFMAVQTR